MLISNSINIPLAIFTVILRRFIDRVRHPEPPLPVACSATSWLYSHPVLRPIVYSYLFIAAVRFLLKRLQRGTVVSVAASRPNPIAHRQRTPARQRGHNAKKSFVLKNMKRNRASQQKALKYVASLTPEPVLHPRLIGSKTSKHYNYDLSTYTFNPYFEPKSVGKLHGAPISGNQSVISGNETCCSDEIQTILGPKDKRPPCVPTCRNTSATTMASLDTYYDQMSQQQKEDSDQQQSRLASASITSTNSEATTSRQNVPKRKKRSGTNQTTDDDCESYRRTRSGKIYDHCRNCKR